MSRPKPNAPNTRAWTAPLATLTPSARSTAWTRPLGPVAPVAAPARRKARLPPLPSIEAASALWGGVVGRA